MVGGVEPVGEVRVPELELRSGVNVVLDKADLEALSEEEVGGEKPQEAQL